MAKGIKELIRGIEAFVGWAWKVLKGLIKVCLLVVGLLLLGYVILMLIAPESLTTYRGAPSVPARPPIVLKPVVLGGRGDSVIDVGRYYQYTKAHLVCRATSSSSNFIVVPYDKNNNRCSSIVNAIVDETTPYDGVVKWDQRADTLEIKAECLWTIVLSR